MIKIFFEFRFCKPLHMSELNIARDIIEIQYNGHMGFARLSPAFRATIGNDALPVSFSIQKKNINHIFYFLIGST